MELIDRSELSTQLMLLRELPDRVSDAFFDRHPEWEARFGARGRMRCTEDARFHLGFLAGAIQAGRVEGFAEYTRWTSAMLAARGIDAAHLIEHLELVAAQLDHELPSDRAAYARRFIQAACASLGAPPSETHDEITPHATLQTRYLATALSGQRAAAYEVACEALQSGWPIAEVYRDMLIASQRRLGELWASATISVAQEHLASAVTSSVLARLSDRLPKGPTQLGRAVIAGVEGELHSLPACFAADLLALDGWDVAFLGTHVPEAAVLSFVAEHKPDLLGLSVTMPGNLAATVRLIQSLRERAPTLRIMLGGRAIIREASLAAELNVELVVA